MTNEASQLERLTTALAGRYKLERRLGEGGMATVYLAEDLKNHRLVAIKVLKPEIALALGSDRFLREIEITARLDHPHILPLLDSGHANGFLYYVMPYVEGETLRDRLNREKHLPIDDAFQITHQVADALDFAHRHDIVHRDIKPENILLAAGHARVVDFGIARAVTSAGGERLTETGLVVGTPEYMSPEQATGESDLDGRSDVYGLACVLYEMVGGQPPFTGPSTAAVIARHSIDPVPRLRTLRPTIPDNVERAVEKALAKVPADRFATARSFADALAAGTASPPDHTARRRPRSRSLVLGAVMLTVLGASVAWFVFGSQAAEEAPLAENAVAVFPFEVRGSEELAYLGEGMMDLLSTKLDGAGELRSIDPHAVMSLVRPLEGRVDPARASVLAEQAGAGLYVLGSVVEVGGRLQLRGSLFSTREQDTPLALASLEGTTAELFELVDRLVAELLAERYGDATQRFARLASRTSPSLDALKAYLDGEHLLRAGRWSDARWAFARAVETDTAFALANYRLATLAGWGTDGPPAITRGAAARALRHAHRLSPRDRQVLEAFVTLERDVVASVSLYRDLVARYPDEVEGWFWLGNLLLINGPLWGWSISGARAPLERVLALDSTHNRALVHLMEVAALERRYAEFDALFRRLDRTATFELWAGATHTALQGDSAARAQLRVELERASDADLTATVMHTAFLLDDLGEVERLAGFMTAPQRAPPTRARGHGLVAALAMARGQGRAALEELRKAEPLDMSGTVEHRAMLATLPFIEVPDSEVAQVRIDLERWDASATPAVTRGHAYALHPHLRAYLLGVVNARLGEHRAARQYADSVERLGESDGGTWTFIARDLGDAVRSHILWREARHADALALLEQIPYRRRGSDSDLHLWRPFFSHLLERYLHGEILVTLGRDTEAQPWYESLVSHDAYAMLYEAPTALRRGEIAERLGQREAATRYYARFVDLWQDADPRLQPQVEEVKQRLVRLGGEPQ